MRRCFRQSLVLCPTRELADQVAGELRRLARFLPNTKILTLCGGQPFGAQRDSFSMRRTLLSRRRDACSITCKKAPSRWMRYKRW
jgi:superfamily II DNA or RNA helicase